MNLIAAVDNNWAIGNKRELLADIPEDKRLFRELTVGKTIVGGRVTMEGFPGGKPLPDRKNIMLTRRDDISFGDALIAHDLTELFKMLVDTDSDDIFFVGGEQVYREALPFCTRAYITKINYEYEADAHMDNLDDLPEWKLTMQSDEYTFGDISYKFTIYERF